MGEKFTFENFLTAVDGGTQEFVLGLHEELTKLGCKTEVKLAKSGYIVSYSMHQKTLANYVFRKSGLFVRIYAGHIGEYMGILDSFPEEMVKAIQKAPICKRLFDDSACNQRCSKGYDFLLKGERMQKCRNSAFFFLLGEESGPYIREILLREAKACERSYLTE